MVFYLILENSFLVSFVTTIKIDNIFLFGHIHLRSSNGNWVASEDGTYFVGRTFLTVSSRERVGRDLLISHSDSGLTNIY